MKTNFFKIVLPMAVVALGLTSAASNSTMNNSVAIQGYKHIASPDSCEESVTCSNNGNFACTAPDDNSQLYSLSGASCLVPLTRNVK